MTDLHIPATPVARGADPTSLNLDDSVFSRLLKERIILLGSEVNDQVANRICAQLLLLAAEDPDREINLWINSPGGSVTAGMAIYDTMQFVGNDVVTVAMGLAASMGQLLLCAGTKGKRYALPHARIMMHQPSGGIGGTASDIAIRPSRCSTPSACSRSASPSTPASRKTRSRPTPTATAGSPPRRRVTTASSTTWCPGRGRCRPAPGPGTEENQMTDLSMAPGFREVTNRYILPSFVERTSYGIKEMNPYNKMFEERIIFLGVQIDDASANDVMAQLLTL